MLRKKVPSVKKYMTMSWRNVHLMVKGKGSDWDGSSGVKGFT